jgi:hypothetical protein
MRTDTPMTDAVCWPLIPGDTHPANQVAPAEVCRNIERMLYAVEHRAEVLEAVLAEIKRKVEE